MTVPIISCGLCKHLILDKERSCKAFPNGIPNLILNGKNDHKKPFPGDNGILFEPIK